MRAGTARDAHDTLRAEERLRFASARHRCLTGVRNAAAVATLLAVTGSTKKPRRPLSPDSAFDSIPEATEIEGDEAWEAWTRAVQEQAAPAPRPAAQERQAPGQIDIAYAPTEPAPLFPTPPDDDPSGDA